MDDAARYESFAEKVEKAGRAESLEDDPVPAVKEWPTLPAEALAGLAGDVVRMSITDCEADPAAVLATFLTWFGAACGKPDGTSPYVSIGETRHAPRLFTAVVGASARARKGTSKYPVQRFMRESQRLYASFCLVCPESEGPLSSGEGIIYRLRDAGEETDKNGELIDKGAGDKRLIVLESELGGVFKVMQRDGSIVSTVLRVAWDGGVIEPLTKNNRIKASDPHLCVVGHITRDELKELLTQVDLRNGLANRFLWCMARRCCLVSRPRPMPTGPVAAVAERIADALRNAHDHPVQIAWSADALDLWDSLYPTLTAERPGAWGYATARAEAQVQRLALIYALLDGARSIRQEHLESAYGFWRYCDASADYLFGEAVADPVGNKILEALRAQGGEMSQTELHGFFGRNLPAAQLAAALALLQEHGYIGQETRKTSGRPGTVWKLLLTKKEERT